MSVRTSAWRYTRWCRWRGDVLAVDWNNCSDADDELFNHTADVALYDVEHDGEPLNVAGWPNVSVVVAEMRALLRKGFPVKN